MYNIHKSIVGFFSKVLIVLMMAFANFGELFAGQQAISLDTIAGPLPRIVKAQKNPYYVIADIEVSADKEVTIEPGVVFLFKNFTGFHILGKLTAQGTRSQPIIFTSENDQKYNPNSALMPNPYDWNGIYVHSDAFGSLLSCCNVSYTVYGIICDTKYLRLEHVILKDNGKGNFTIEGKEQQVSSEPYNYSLTRKDVAKEGISILSVRDQYLVPRNIIRYTGLVAAIGGFGFGIYYAAHFKDSWKDWKEINAADVDIDLLTGNDPGYYKRTEDRKNKDLLYMCVGLGGGLIGAVGFAVSFSF